jgi:hypothetical protein
MSNAWTTNVDASLRKPNAFHLSDSVTVQKSAATVFKFIVNDLPAHYSDIAKGHKKFEVVGSDEITEGASIECQEMARNVEVHHRYEVKKVIPNKHIHFCTLFSSNPTRAYIQSMGKTIEGKSATYVYYDLEEMAPEETQLTLSIVIQMPNLFFKLTGILTGQKKLWGNHLSEELNGLKGVIEKSGN